MVLTSSKNAAVFAGGLLVIFFVSLVLAMSMQLGNGTSPTASEENTEFTEGAGTPVSKTRAAVTGRVAVPEENSSNVPANVATPTVVGPASAQTSASFRSFDIKVDGNKFVPDTIVVKKNDVVHVNIFSVDRDYDFAQPDYGFKLPLPKGQSRAVEFAATAPGVFKFFCTECGGPDKGPLGQFIIVPE